MPRHRLAWIGMVALSLWAATVYAHSRHDMGMMGSGRMLGDAPSMMLPLVLKGVELTEEQEQRVREIMTAHRATFRTLFSELQGAHKDLADKLFAPGEIQTADLTAPMQRVAEVRERIMQQGLKVALEVRALLTPDQLAKAAELKDRVRALRTEMRGLFRGKR